MTRRCSLFAAPLLLLASCWLNIQSMAIAGSLNEDPKVTQLRANLTSKNREPQIKNQGTGPSVVITKDFSWDEQARVQGEVGRLARNPTEELVTQLFSVRNSSEYCLSTINDNESIHNHDVGQVATDLIRAVIEIPLKEAFEDVPADDTNPFKKALIVEDAYSMSAIEDFLLKDQLKLYEVQLKQLEKSKAELLKKYPDSQLAANVIKKIDAYHKSIRDNKKPILQAIAYPILEEYFDAHELSRAKVTTASPK